MGDWALVTFALPIQGTNDAPGTQTVTASLQVLPYGSGAATGLQYQVRPPILYVVGDINDARHQQHQVFTVVDLNVDPRWELNFGVGVGLTHATDRLTLKMILGRRF